MTAVGRTDAFAARALEVGIALGTGRPAVPGNSKVSPVPREGWTQSKAALGQRLRDSLPVFCCLCSRKGEGSGHHGADAHLSPWPPIGSARRVRPPHFLRQ